MSRNKPLFGYWDFRGLAHPVTLLCHYLGVDHEERWYSKGEDLTGDSWFKEKYTLGLEFPNLPYWIDNEVKLTEARAILKYVAHVHGPPKLKALTAKQQGAADMVEGVVTELYSTLMSLLFFHTHIYIFRTTPVSDEEMAGFNKSTSPRFQELDKFLENKQWVAGDNLSYVDFYVYECIFQMKKWKGDLLDPYPTLKGYMARFEAIPEVAACIKKYSHMYCLGVNAGF